MDGTSFQRHHQRSRVQGEEEEDGGATELTYSGRAKQNEQADKEWICQLTMALAAPCPRRARRWHTARSSPRPGPQSKVTSHALTARGSNDNGLILIEKYLKEVMFKF
jgi:hypothetical protein